MTPDALSSELLPQIVQQALDVADTPGAALAVRVDGTPFADLAVGFADLACTQPLAADSRWYVYSVTKSLIATLMMQLAEQGVVALDAPVQTYLADVALPHAVTLRQLLNHTGGLPDYGGLPAYTAALKADSTTPWSDAEFLALTLAGGALFAPGQGWAYSNLGYLLLRRVLETVYGQTFSAVVHTQLAVPLGLKQTRVIETLAAAEPLTPGFSSFFSAAGLLEPIHTRYHPGWVAHGVAGSTAAELAHLIDALGAGTLVSASSLATMLDAVPVTVQHPLFREPAYGLGLMVDLASPAGLLFGHGGGGPGYAIGALHLPNANGRRITAVAMANRDQPDLGMQIAFEAAMFAGAGCERDA
jgi:D-alanyl-D-alanine carboxypeptidase